MSAPTPLERALRGVRDWLADLPHLRSLLLAAQWLGLCRTGNRAVSLTRRGSLWLHWLQNYVALPAVNTLWTAGQAEAWPGRIRI